MIVIAMVFPTLGTWLYFIVAAGQPWAQAAYAASKVVQFGFPIFWVAVILKRPPRFAWPGTAGILPGLAFGLAVLAFLLGVYFLWMKPHPDLAAAPEQIRSKLAGFGITAPAAYLLLAVFYCGAHSALEEYYWRWFVFGELRRLGPLGMAIGLSSLAFMAHHVIIIASYLAPHYLAVVGASMGVAVGGAVWAWIYDRTGSLLGPWLSHLLVDAAIMLIGYEMLFGRG